MAIKKPAKKSRISAKRISGEIQQYAPDKLRLDLTNPRFGLAQAADEDEALLMLLDKADLKELWDSISERGYEKFEPLVITKERGALVVLEGNRRLAAVKLLLNPERLPANLRRKVPKIGALALKTCEKLPAILVSDRTKAAGYIGFKHVNGPARWSSLAKAKFGVEFYESFKKTKTPQERMSSLTKQLGDSRGLIIRLLVAYKIVRQCEALGIFETLGINEGEIEFSHLYTLINNPASRDFIGISKAPLNEDMIVDDPVPKTHHRQLRELIGWLYGEKSVIQSQGSDRPRLQRVLANTDAIRELRATGQLSSAVAVAGLQSEDWLETLANIAALANKANGDASAVVARLSEDDKAQAQLLMSRTSTILRQIASVFTVED